MRFPVNVISIVLAALAGAGAGGAVAYNQVAGSPSARMEAPSAVTTAPTVQTEPKATNPAPQEPPASQAEAPKAQPSGQAPSATSQPQAIQSGGADVTTLEKQVANHEQRIETLEQSKSAPTQASEKPTADQPTSEKPTSEKPSAPVEHQSDGMLRPVPVLPFQ